MKQDTRFSDSYISWDELVGKTIEKVDYNTACNVVQVTFSDQTQVSVDTAPVGHGLYTPVLCKV